jgi:hypothetical protein
MRCVRLFRLDLLPEQPCPHSPNQTYLEISRLSGVSEFVGRISEDGDDPTALPIRVNERRPVDAIAARPADGERSIGILDVDRFALAISGEPHGEEIRAVEQPRIADGSREQHQLTNSDDAAVMLGRPALDIVHLVGQPKGGYHTIGSKSYAKPKSE